MRFFGRWWVCPPVIYAFFVIELLLTVALLALFGIADPDTYRTKLWQEGSLHGWNSNPNEILYSYANYRPMQTPLVWSTRLNNYNVVISVLGVFLLLTKSVMMVMRVWFPPLSVLIHLILIGIFSYSAYAQASHDLSDPQHPQTGPPWYITKSCSVSSTDSIKGYCEQAKASFALTVVSIVIFFLNVVWAVYSNFFGKAPPEEVEEEDEYKPSIYDPKGFSPDSATTPGQQWEMQHIPAAYNTSNVPYTPRTQAFHTLGGSSDLPLRAA